MTVIDDRHSSAPECSTDLLVLGLIACVVINVQFYIIWRRTTVTTNAYITPRGSAMQLCVKSVMRAEELKIQTDSNSIYVIIVLASLLFFSLITIYLNLVENHSICFSMMSPSFFSFSLLLTWLPTQTLLHAFDFKQNYVVFYFSLRMLTWLSEKRKNTLDIFCSGHVPPTETLW